MADTFYVDSTYWPDGYAVYVAQADLLAFNNASLTCDADVIPGAVIVEFEINLGFYIDSNYFYPSDYFEETGSAFGLTADLTIVVGEIVEASGAWSSSASITATAGLIKVFDSTMVVTSTVTATISHIEGADLFAFTEAALAVEVSRIRDNNISASSAFTISTDASRTRTYSSEEDAAFAISIDNLRVRFNQAAIDAAFSLAAELTLAGSAKQFTADLASQFEQSATADRLRDVVADLASAFEQSVINDKLVSANSDLASQFDQSAAVNLTAEFIVALDTSATVSAVISHIHGADLQAFDQASLAVDADVVRQLASDISSNSTLSTVANIVQALSSSMSSQFAITAIGQRTQQASADLSSQFAQTTNASRIQANSINLSSAFTQSATGDKFTNFFDIEIKDVPDGTNNWYSRPVGLYVDTTGNMYSSGAMGTGSTGYDSSPAITKVNKFGEHQWTKTLVTTSPSAFTNLVSDSSGNLYTLTRGSNTIIKYNSSGTVVWRYNTSNTSVQFNQIAIDSSNNIIAVGGYTFSSSTQGYVVKINSAGALQWNKRITGESLTNVVVDGTSTYTSNRGAVIKLDSTGAHVWTRGISRNGSSMTDVYSLSKDTSGNIYVAPINATESSWQMLVKFNSSGNKLWHRDYNSRISDVYDSGTDVYITSGQGIGTIDPSNGAVLWNKNPSSSLDSSETSLVVKNSGLYFQGSRFTSVANPYQFTSLIYRFPTDGSGIPTVGTYTFNALTDTTTSTTTFATTAATVTNLTGITLTTNTTTLGTKTPTTTFNAVNPGGYLQTGAATLTTAATLSNTANIIKSTSASISSSSSITAQPDNNLKSVTANITANGFVAVINGRIRPEVADLVSSFSLSINAGNLIVGVADLTTSASLTAQAQDLDLAEISLTSNFTLSLDSKVNRLAQATLSSQATQVTAAIKTVSITKTLTSTSTLTSTIKRTRSTPISLSPRFTVTAQAARYPFRPWYTWNSSSSIESNNSYSNWERIRVDNIDLTATTFTDTVLLDLSGYQIRKSLLNGSNILTVNGVSRYTAGETTNFDILRNSSFSINDYTFPAFNRDPNTTGTLYDVPGTDTFVWNKTQSLTGSLTNSTILTFFTLTAAGASNRHQIRLFHNPTTKLIQAELKVVYVIGENEVSRGVTNLTYTQSTPVKLNVYLYRMPGSGGLQLKIATEVAGVENLSSSTGFSSFTTTNPGSTTAFYSGINITALGGTVVSTPYLDYSGLVGNNLLITRTGFDESSILSTNTYKLSDQKYVLGLYDAVGSIDRIGILGQGQAGLSSAFSQSVNPTKLVQAASNFTSAFTQSSTVKKIARTPITCQSTVTLSSLVRRIRGVGASLQSTATLSVTAKKYNGGFVTTTSNALVNAQPYDFSKAQAALTSSITANASVLRIKQLSAEFTAFYVELTAASKNATGTILLESTSTLTCAGVITADQPQYMFSQTQMTTTGVNTQFGSGALTSTSEFNLVPTYLRRNESVMTVTASVTANNSRTRNNTSTQLAQFFAFPSTDNSKITGYSAAWTSTSQVVTNNQILRLAQANLLSEFNHLPIYAGVLVRFEADLQVNGFVLSAGEILNIDLFNQLKIASETRTLWVEEEYRILAVNSETRVNKIKGNP